MGCDWGVCENCYQKAQKRSQFNSMVQKSGFSGGFKSYRHFFDSLEKHGKMNSPESPAATRRKSHQSDLVTKQRSNFFKRDPGDFGVLVETKKDTDHWSQSTRTMGPRSCSEGALLRYAQSAVQNATRSVYDDMRVDVTKTDMRQLRKASFIAGLDMRPEVTPEFLRDASSATAQAVQKMLAPTKPSDPFGGINKSSSAPRRLTALQGAGNSMVGSGKSKSR
jgi:hypothetical protein